MANESNLRANYENDGKLHISLTIHPMPIELGRLITAMVNACHLASETEGVKAIWFLASAEMVEGKLRVVLDGREALAGGDDGS